MEVLFEKVVNLLQQGVKFGGSVADFINTILKTINLPLSPRAASILSLVVFVLVLAAVWKTGMEVGKYLLIAVGILLALSLLGVI